MGVVTAFLLAIYLSLPLALSPVGKTGAMYDAAAHRLEARGAAAADPRTPSADVARVKAERQARADAAHKLQKALSALGDRSDDAAMKKLLDAAIASNLDYGADGSVSLTLAISTDGLTLTSAK